MASRADVERFAQANRAIRRLVLLEVSSFWNRLDHTDVDAVRRALEEFLPGIVAGYGEVAATVAADFFDEMRAAAGARGRMAAVLASEVDAEQVRVGARWALAPLFGADPKPADALGRLGQVADRLTLQAGRDTIAASVARDPANARWARVPVGKTCAFCKILASRGPAYRSAETAGNARKWHADCDCAPTPMWSDADLPAGYDPDALRAEYEQAAMKSGGGLRETLAVLREQAGSH